MRAQTAEIAEVAKVAKVARLAVMALFVATGAFAQGSSSPAPPGQNTTNPGVGEPKSDPKQVDKGQNMILPSAGSAGQSAAPTMVYDCQKRPQDCTDPASPADRRAAPDPKEKQPIKP
jgi:hypothetical protein